MACILKIPTDAAKGIVVFTTQERDRIVCIDRRLRAGIESLKSRWVIGLHHNWHDYRFRYDPLFDFSMAGEDDLKTVDGSVVPVIPLDACNFVPSYFRPGQGEKFWDILYVARAVYFKKIPEFFRCIRILYDHGHRFRVLFICPVPPYVRRDRKTVFYDIRTHYDSMFNEAEKDRFTLLTLDYRYPFPFDLETLAYFYRSSRIFVHFADDEKRCRVAAYAWASGLPVVGMECVGSLLPNALRHPPHYYAVSRYDDFSGTLITALDRSACTAGDSDAVRHVVSSEYTLATLDAKLKSFCGVRGVACDGPLCGAHLDIRLGRHHGIGSGPNTVAMSLDRFVAILAGWSAEVAGVTAEAADPEEALVASLPPLRSGLLKRFLGRMM